MLNSFFRSIQTQIRTVKLSAPASKAQEICEVIVPLNQKINNIQALRAFAAIAVVIFHTGYVVPHMLAIGSFGVDIFFVISGYIMARICETNPNFFLRRRLVRILPPYWAMTILLFLFAWKFPQLLKATQASGPELIKSLLFIPYYKSNGLLRPLLFVGWSLNYEMFFYVALTGSLLILPTSPLLLTSGIILTIVGICHFFIGRGAIPAFYANVVMVEFIFGILAYFAARSVSTQKAIKFRGFSLLCFTGSLFAIVFHQGLPQVSNAWYPWLVTAAISFVMVTSASLLSQGGWDTEMAWVVLIGDSSYVLYLLHPYSETLIDKAFARHIPLLAIDHLFGSLFATVISIGLAVLLHLKLEIPSVAYLNRRFGGKRKSTGFTSVSARSPATVPPLEGTKKL
jgi:exopolysaccharide production protein ExoZ